MILLVSLNPGVITFLSTGFVILLLALLLKKYKQPYIIAYILAGIILGPFGLKIITNREVIKEAGELGLIILMFFIGMEIYLPDFLKKWKVALLGTGMQVLFSIGLVTLMGLYLDWPWSRMVLVGFILSLSSSAVVIKLLDSYQETKTPIGRDVISILLTQDILIVPMMVIIGFFGGDGLSVKHIATQLTGGILVILLLIYIIKTQHIRMPFAGLIRTDHELQVFAGLILCFGLSLATSLFDLSAALGAFVGGMLVHSARETVWLHESLHSFRVVLVAIFFVSIGLLIDLEFLKGNWMIIGIMVLVIYISNQSINAFALKALGNTWKASFYGGALLAQIGELSFILTTMGYQSGIISEYTYQLSVIVISITIFISPFWITMSRNVADRKIKN